MPNESATARTQAAGDRLFNRNIVTGRATRAKPLAPLVIHRLVAERS
jgi:hypothetical protein